MTQRDEALRRTDASEVRFQETIPDNQNASTQQSITYMPTEGPDTLFHVDKRTSVTETGYGGVSGRGHDISGIVEQVREHSPRLDHRGGESFTDKMKDFVHGLKDLATGKKQQEASVPIERGAHHGHEHKKGVGDKVKDFMTGQKPGHGPATSTAEGSEDRLLNEVGNPNPPTVLDPVNSEPNVEPPSTTYKDPHGCAIEGPRDDNTKKEGVRSKVMDKFDLGTNKGSE